MDKISTTMIFWLVMLLMALFIIYIMAVPPEIREAMIGG